MAAIIRHHLQDYWTECLIYYVRQLEESVMKDVTRRFNPKEAKEIDRIILESYDDFVRLERRNLLIVSSIILVSTFSNIDFSAASIFGLSFKNLDQRTYYTVLSCLVFYFSVAFATYGITGFKKAITLKREIIKNSGSLTYAIRFPFLEFPNFSHEARYRVWLTLHFILPVFLGVVSFVIGVIKIV